MAFTTPSGVADSGVAFSDVNNINFLDTNTSQDTEPTSANSDLDSIEEDVGKTEDRYGRPYYPGEGRLLEVMHLKNGKANTGNSVPMSGRRRESFGGLYKHKLIATQQEKARLSKRLS